ncbi:MAG: type II secretion system secretin GspD [Pseudomonadota bacterium]|nr:type II secretion system secretin GspD [Pseudomonadota bacterium]
MTRACMQAVHRVLRRAGLCALFSVLSFGTLPASTPAVKAPAGASITPNYKDADLGQIIQAVSEVTGKNFIVDPRVNAKVTMLSATPMSPAAFYEAFLAVLQVYGFVAVPAGQVIKIIPNTDARQLPSIDLPRSVSSNSDEIVTQIITVKNISASQLVPMLRPLIPQQGHLAAYPNGNMLIVSDRASNVSRLMKIIERMDESGDEPVDVVQLHGASATELVRAVNQLNQNTGGAEGGGAPIKVVADERTNSVLISGQKSLRLRTKALVLRLDTPLLGGGGNTQVRYLLYADADKLVDKLKGQVSTLSNARGSRPAGGFQGPPAGSSAMGGPQAGGPPGGGPQAGGSQAGGSPAGGSPQAGGSQAGGAQAAPGGSNLDASVTIWADTPTNALIITAPPDQMKSLMAVIDKLDIRRAQVEIEAMIVEVQVNNSASLSVQWLLAGYGGYGVSNLPGSGTSVVNLAAAAASTSSSSTSSLTSAIPTGATYALGTYNSSTGQGFAAVVQALQSDGTSNIISTPRIITMNNEEAEVKVTQEIPLVTGQYTSSSSSTSGTTSPFQTIQREEVGTILKVTPHIGEGDVIQLKIEQEDSSPGAKLANSSDISTNKRSIKSTILIEDGGIIVLGGLMKDTVSESEDRIPVLGSIPLLGNLFKSRSGSRQKTNLLVFLRPKILRDQAAAETLSSSRYNEIRDQEKSLHKGNITLLPGEKQPSLPAMTPRRAPTPAPTAAPARIPTPAQAPDGSSLTPPQPPAPAGAAATPSSAPE